MFYKLTASILTSSFLCCVSLAWGQQPGQDFPAGPGKDTVVAVCNGCHDINRVRVGYTPDGWLTVVRMMQNMQAPVPAEEWGAMTDYLIRNFPERKRPAAVIARQIDSSRHHESDRGPGSTMSLSICFGGHNTTRPVKEARRSAPRPSGLSSPPQPRSTGGGGGPLIVSLVSVGPGMIIGSHLGPGCG